MNDATRQKFPALLSFDDVLARLDAFDTIIDARSPSEFAEDHLPGAINCPVLDDAERVRIGTLYKQVNSFEAKKVGAALVARNIGTQIEAHFLDKPRDWKPLVYCWRGGNRSGSMAYILARIGWQAVQLDGGYKEFRRHVNAALSTLPQQFRYRVICGTTGSGKSRLLQTLEAAGAQVLDLERLAAHRGSVLGHLPDAPQPTQKMFETRLWKTLRRFDPAKDVFVESESKKVGNVRVPDALMQAMRSSPCVALDLPDAARVELLMADYAHFVDSPDSLNRQLDCLHTLYGSAKIARWQAMATEGDMEALVAELLVEHYDPAYRRSIARNFTHYDKAQPLAMPEFSDAAFATAAGVLYPDANLQRGDASTIPADGKR
jgi:tRNA 2-selenouridine synthase